jgi:hypothetical protein
VGGGGGADDGGGARGSCTLQLGSWLLCEDASRGVDSPLLPPAVELLLPRPQLHFLELSWAVLLGMIAWGFQVHAQDIGTRSNNALVLSDNGIKMME